MSLSFIIPLVIFLVAVYIFKNSADEIAYLCAAIALVSLVVSLVLAPWPLQLLLLMIVLISNRRHSLPSEPVVESPEEEKAKLVYRGANYEVPPPTVDVKEAEATGKYRGLIWKARNIGKISGEQSAMDLDAQDVSVPSKLSRTSR